MVVDDDDVVLLLLLSWSHLPPTVPNLKHAGASGKAALLLLMLLLLNVTALCLDALHADGGEYLNCVLFWRSSHASGVS